MGNKPNFANYSTTWKNAKQLYSTRTFSLPQIARRKLLQTRHTKTKQLDKFVFDRYSVTSPKTE
jgi:hypothetical protein